MVNHRSTQRLCGAVRTTVQMVLDEAGGRDELLFGAYVERVVPHPDESRLRVEVSMPAEVEEGAWQAHLGPFRDEIRNEVARTLNRRKTPDLVYQLVDPTEPQDP